MNGIPDFILYVIIFDVIVGVVILGYVVRRWKGFGHTCLKQKLFI